MCCWRAWRPMAASICPKAGRNFRTARSRPSRACAYQDAAFAILSRFTAGSFSDAELSEAIAAAYAGFDAPEIAPLVEIGEGRLPAGAVPRPHPGLQGHRAAGPGPAVLAAPWRKRGGRATIVAATSGDTGSAAIAALGGLPNIDVFVMHPKGRVSDVQRLQMTTSAHANVHNIALEGSFDDAQAIVKALFADTAFARRDQPDGGQFHQLRPHRGAVRLLLHRHGAAGQARHLRGAHRQFRRHLRRRGRDAHGPGRRRGW